MRDILDKFNVILESTGLAGRMPGTVFKNQNDDEIIFNELKFYPEKGGQYSSEQIDQLLQELEPLQVQWLNNKSSKTGGVGIATFTDKENNEIYVGQFFQKINPNLKQNYMPNTVLGYSLETKSSKKTREKLKPQDLLDQKVDLTIADIMNQLAISLGTDNPLYSVAHRIAMGEPLPLKFTAPPNVTFSGFRDYFCEILQPMALQMGQYTGNAAEAARIFLNGSFKNTLITFDESVTAGLSDSIISTKDGKQILLSTKGGQGATASAKNLFDKIEQLEETDMGKKFLQKYKEEVDIIKSIVEYGQNGSPLYLGVRFDIIDEKEANQIKNLRNTQPIDLKNINTVPITPRLKKFAIGRDTKTPETTDLYYHLMSVIAEKVAKEINEKTKFSKAAAEILNNGALIQVYTKAKEGTSEWILSEFNTVYPSEQIKGVYLESRKTYYSTGIKGNFTFKIDKGSGVPKDEPQDTPFEPSDDLETMAKQITGQKVSKPKPAKKVGDVGREKRK